MNKVVIGMLVGLVLGALDGATAWFTPEVRSQLAGIMIGSSIKGLLVGLAAGFYARKVNSTGKGIAFAAVIGLALAAAVAAMPDPSGKHFWLQIMLPGFITGAMIGFFTQRYGASARQI
jgi:Na+/pantothenate symporter